MSLPGPDPVLLDTVKGYHYAGPFACGRTLVQLNDRFFYLDADGQALFHNDCALVFNGDPSTSPPRPSSNCSARPSGAS